MEKLKEAVRKLKDELYNLQVSTKGSDLDRILNMKDLTDDAKRELLLLFSNIKEEIHDLKSYQLVTLSKATDAINEIIKELEQAVLERGEKFELIETRLKKVEEEQSKSLKSIILGSTLYKAIIGFMALVIFLVTLHGINPNSTKWASELVKGMFSFGSNSTTTEITE
jgi:hypothetical protein